MEPTGATVGGLGRYAVVDGKLATGQNPAFSEASAKACSSASGRWSTCERVKLWYLR